MSILLVAAGGFIGSVMRFLLSVKANKHLIGTWIANISGSVLLAFLLHFYLHEAISENVWLFLGVGFCGAYTTFSTFGNETLFLILDKKYKRAVGYVSSSIITSLLKIGRASCRESVYDDGSGIVRKSRE